jgi:hypothetical protein
MIVNTDAVIYPRAVMVEAFNAPIADGAMPAAACSYNLAIRTEL